MKSNFLKILFTVYLSLFLFGCTYSVTMAHTEGEATDIVDETTDNSPNVKAPISLPL